jgi:DNA-binding NtrC family response regulator
VENDLDWQDEIAEVLSEYELIMASSVGEAYRRIDEVDQQHCAIDLVILDLGLSKTTGIDSGLAVLTHLRDRIPEVPCVILTGRTLPMSKAARLFQKYHIFDGLEKPGDMPRLSKVARLALMQTEGTQYEVPPGERRPLLDEVLATEIEGLVREDRLTQALEKLVDLGVHRREVNLLAGRLRHTQNEERRGTLAHNEADTKYTRIAQAILDLLSK